MRLRLVWVFGLAAPAIAGCGPEPPSRSTSLAAEACPEGALSPATAAPAVGLWADRDGSRGRVTARIGSTQPSGSASGALWHRVEALESLPGKPPLRVTHDSATVRLDLLPSYPTEATGLERARVQSGKSHPAATYAVSGGVLLASYESCAALNPEPVLRYLRRDERGRVVTDAILYRQSASP